MHEYIRRRNKQRSRTWTFLFVVLIMFSACDFAKSKEAGEIAVVRFHNLFNQKRFQDIHQEASEEFKSSDSERDFAEYFVKIRQKLGTVKHSSLSKWSLNKTTDGSFITLDYSTEFSEGNGAEQFIFKVKADTLTLYNYRVTSALLVVESNKSF